jgi:Holliday junction resolvase-like predicted endonuclease
MEEIRTNYTYRQINEYGIRIQKALELSLETKDLDAILNKIKDEFCHSEDLIKQIFGVSIEELQVFLIRLNQYYQFRFERNKATFTYNNEGWIDTNNYLNYIIYGQMITIPKGVLLSLEPKIEKLLDSLTLNKDEFNPLRLEFDILSQKPLLKIKNDLIVNLELLWPGILLNLRYSLLEHNELIKEEYKKRNSSAFEDKVANTLARYNYELIVKNFMLYNRKNQIGDVDVMVRHKNTGKFLYVECKDYNHKKEIQAHNAEAILENLKTQQRDWESKVKARIDKLKNDYPDRDSQYIIVTKLPEILSHFSDILVLDIHELEIWCKSGEEMSFENIYNERYTGDLMTNEEMDLLSVSMLKAKCKKRDQ